MLLDVISKEVEVNIIDLVDNKNLFKNYYPDNPNNIVSIIDGGGYPPNRYSPIREKTIEFKIRSQRYPDGVELGNKIFNLFHSKEKYSLGDFFITASYVSSELTYLYADSQNRKEFSLELVFQYQY
ncbi:minor capsid protein [Virgibacillus sp. SK37]|uniref:minor capsid protein n=1 Tax=Virgibacillus sp. SK37 TaxID=403957 RepID=UPI0004D1B02F|nr:minor capsid protein [Virgibacillus sp. SK37]AIF45432.1 hypothetical protein X953_10165 [Virgibacillus sp. SK37]